MRRLAGILVVITLFGCSANSLAPLPPGDICSSDSDCDGPQVCRYDVCIVPNAEARRIGFRLVPSNSSIYRPQIVSPAEVDFDEPLAIALRTSIRVEGKLLFRGVDGRVSASGPPGVLTFRREETEFALPPTQTKIGNDSAYSVLLLPGRYTMTFKADDPEIPTKVWGAREFTLDTDPELSIAQQSIRLQGTVRDSSMPGMVQVSPVSDARLIAISRDTGSTTTLSTTDASGEFVISALPFSGAYDLKVTTTLDEDRLVELEFESAFDCPDERCQWNLSDGENLEVNIPTILGSRRDTKVVLIGPGEARPNWAGVKASIESEQPWGQLRLTYPVAASGELRFPLPAGNYDLTVIPPEDFPLSRYRVSFDVGEDTTAREIEVPARTLFSAVVVDPMGEPIPDATVEFQAIDSVAETPSRTTDADGKIELPLDLYEYWVTIIPNIPSLPQTIRFLPASQIVSQNSVTLMVSEPTALAGEVLGAPETEDAKWKGVTDVAIQAFELVNNRPIPVAEATTRDDGKFQMIVSSKAPETEP